MSSMTRENSSKLVRPSPLACTECRKKHLKCDARTPVCSRCTTRGLDCNYTPSRRGIGGRTKRQHTSVTPDTSNRSPPTPNRSSNVSKGSNEFSQLESYPTQVVSPARTWTDLSDASQHSSAITPPASSTSRSSLRSEDEHLTNCYFVSFHPCHPILVPRTRYTNQRYPEHLQAVVRFIGSHYAQTGSEESARSAAAAFLAEQHEQAAETVQALLLYAIALHSRYEPMEAMSAIAKATDLAIELGMHRAEYATTYGKADPVLEESFRRTWWELYVTDGYLAALHRHTNFRCNMVNATTLLPCEDSAYAQATVPSPSTSLTQFDARLFADEDYCFSSFCYRIEAIRILSRVIAVSGANEAHADGIQAIDNAIASFKHHIPNDKAAIIDRSGECDQMMFQAFVFIQLASIFLHFPRSELPITMPSSAEITCARQHMEQVSPVSNQHAAKSMAASKDLANLASLPIEKHSPFFICGLVFSCVVQLSACSAYPQSSTQQNRDRVALILGVLKSFGRTWTIAQYVSQQLKRAASEVFTPRPENSTTASGSSYDSGIDMTGFPTDMSWFDFFNHPGDASGAEMQHQLLGGVHDMTGFQ
ncbi:related to C6 transcription factor [Ramularia collo-cygni]|uniref:Related to C6 transcription factor n=1 Tax=Ramularia collo-cygni TaxID=112498 RepID=A0A2D3UUQ6_9PEZI|nr:related to C6 transcription factor [Ramularia collo-cygni]CZT21372.1 related to C6 transcription factor [Ramularia collo-cygni]